MADCKFTVPEMEAVLVLVRHMLPKCEIRRIIGEVMEEGWSVLATPEGDISFQADDVSMLRKILG